MNMTQEKKENVQYTTAIFTLFTGVLMCFLSFFMNKYSIETSVLMYFGQTLIFCAAVFGINLMIKTQVLEAESRLDSKIEKKLKKVDNLIKDGE